MVKFLLDIKFSILILKFHNIGDSSQIVPNELTWAFMSSLTGKKIIADSGISSIFSSFFKN